MNEIVQRFFSKRCLSTEMQLNRYVESAVEIMQLASEEVSLLIDLHVERVEDRPAFLVLHDMYFKCEEFTSGALAAFLIAHIGSAEALCRTAVESAVNLYYVSLGDDLANVLAYFKNYLVTERKQNQQWLKSVEDSSHSNDEKAYHKGLIAKKDETLDYYEEALRGSLAVIDINYDAYTDSWPSVFDRFTKLGKEIDYRTIYAALCSQAHNDAEDVLNNLMARVIPVEGYAHSVEIERYTFSLNMVMTSICFYLEASAMFLAKYEVPITETIVPLWSRTMELAREHTSVAEHTILAAVRKASQSNDAQMSGRSHGSV